VISEQSKKIYARASVWKTPSLVLRPRVYSSLLNSGLRLERLLKVLRVNSRLASLRPSHLRSLGSVHLHEIGLGRASVEGKEARALSIESKDLSFTIATENFLGCSGRIPPSPPDSTWCAKQPETELIGLNFSSIARIPHGMHCLATRKLSAHLILTPFDSNSTEKRAVTPYFG